MVERQRSEKKRATESRKFRIFLSKVYMWSAAHNAHTDTYTRTHARTHARTYVYAHIVTVTLRALARAKKGACNYILVRAKELAGV